MEISKKEKKARKLIKKLEKKRKKEETKNDWGMYEPAGCFACNNGQKINPGRTELDITTYKRCSCSKIKTKKYKKFLKRRDNMLYSEVQQMEVMFDDNNAHIIEGNNAYDRSW